MAMNRSILFGVAFAVALVGPVSAATMYRYFSPTSNPVIVAGEIDRYGRVGHGTGFTALHVGPGKYQIDFSPGVIPSGCAAMVVEPIHPNGEGITTQVHQKSGCGPIFHVYLQYPGTNEKPDHDFYFIAAEEK